MQIHNQLSHHHGLVPVVLSQRVGVARGVHQEFADDFLTREHLQLDRQGVRGQ